MIKKIALSIILYILTILSIHAAPFQNGSFEANSGAFQGATTDTLSTAEQDLTGWTIENISGSDSLEWTISSNGGGVLTGGGNYKIELAGNSAQMRIYQIFDTVAGKNYQVTYYLYGRSGSSSTDREITLTLKDQNSSGTILSSRIDHPDTLETWVQYTATFTASSTSTYIAFENNNASSKGAFLDLIEVSLSLADPTFNSDTRTYVYDPGHEELKAIPGNDMVFMYSLENSGGSPDADTVVMKFSIPTTLNFKLDSFTFVDGEVVGSLGYDPLFDGNSVNSSGLSCCTSEISYSTDGVSFTYTPSPTYYNDFGEGYDPNVRAIRIIPSGTMTDGRSSPTGFRVYYQAQIK